MPLALIFDLDGTLVDTAPDLLSATNAVLAAEGRAPTDTSHLRHMVGFGARSLIAQAMAASGAPADEAEMARLVGIFIDHYRAHIADFSRPFAGVVETLKELRGQGHRLGILTNKPAELTGLLLERLGLGQYFAAVYGAGRKAYSKPDPRIFHDVVQDILNEPPLPSLGQGPSIRGRYGPASPSGLRAQGRSAFGWLGRQPHPSRRFAPKGEVDLRGVTNLKAVMIGDSVTDLSTARAAGAPCILMSYGYTPVPAAELGADMVLDAFAQLPGAVKRFTP